MLSLTILQARTARQRVLTNENDENTASTRLTRAKAAALSVSDVPASNVAVKKPLQTKKSAGNTANATQRRRPALGDVSNVTKPDNIDSKDGKKPTVRSGLTSKATAQAGGIQKLSRNNSSRTALGIKDNNSKKQVLDEKCPGSGSGVGGSSAKKRSSVGEKLVKEEVTHIDEPPRKKVEVDKFVQKSTATSQVQATVGETEPDLYQPVQDLDAEDLDDPLMAAEYVVEIFDYLRELELETMANPEYIEHQPDLEWKMRGILVDWLIEVHTRFRLLPETLFLAVNIIDRFLSAEVVALDRLQLVGVTAMFIASKYEEVLSPHVVHFSRVADETFSEKEILDAERHILATLKYNMSYPNPMNFLRRISKADNYDIQTRTLGKYLMEISLLDHRFMEYPQSHVGAAAMYLARLILERGEWVSQNIQKISLLAIN